MKNLLLFLLALLLTTGAYAHGGEDHGGTAAPSAGPVATTFSVAALSEKFELLLRFEPLEKGTPADMRLFVSDYATNAPVQGAKITVTSPEAADLKFTVTEKAPGSYLVEGQFPVNQKYSLAVNIVAGDRADLMLLSGVEVGKKLPVAAGPAVAAPSLFSSWQNILLLLGAFALGIVLTAFLMRRHHRPATISTTTSPAEYENHA
ncbi:hypothetical protein [Hymenobacter cellulosivorans]|uniref:Copper resistance protein CopC n=1 Tax=Hymenobacter cellulosivorans TaxID=2932249 RepID=A0ABY4F217_9BACT|nr:hypothetical protein [Hymenobacter cellulosivorans]UOQ50737.1 hypothetical protein MUN80_13305 [Hymenobacter cellulosivorans]